MAKLEIAPGEFEIQREQARYVRERMEGWLVLTNRRVLLLCQQPNAQMGGGFLGAMFGMLGRAIAVLVSAATSPYSIAVQIPRRDFRGAHAATPALLHIESVFQNRSFEAAVEHADRWADTLASWADGPEQEPPPQPPPMAKVIKR